MIPVSRRQISIGLLLGTVCLGVVLYLGGLATTLKLGDTSVKGFLLIPALPTPLYMVMALVLLACVGIMLLTSFLRRRKPPEPRTFRQHEGTALPWQVAVGLLAWFAALIVGVIWLARHGSRLWEWIQHLRDELGAIQASLASGTQTVIPQVQSPVAGYALFVVVMVIYGGIALLGLWVLFDTQEGISPAQAEESAQTRRVRRAVTAGLWELQQNADPRHAIIACYARLEHLLEDHGIPAYDTLTPQEYMGTAVQGLNLPMEACAGLIQLFELARYSLHPLDDTARRTAMAHLETIKSHLEGEAIRATRV